MRNRLLLREDTRLHIVYSLKYSLYVTKRRARHFVIEVCDGKWTKTVLLGKSLDAAYRLYLLLVENEVDPCHVDDIIEDMEERYLTINST